MTKFQGSYTVLVTPFTEDERAIDEKALRRLVEWQIKEGVPGLIALGSNGEFLSVTAAERTQVVKTVIDQAAGRVPVLIGTADEWVDNVIRCSKEAEQLGADGVMIVPPYYSTPTEDELFEHFRRVGEAIHIPIMLYNNPRSTHVDLKPEFVARLSVIDTIRYIKESSKDVSRVREITRLCGDGMTIFSGHLAYDHYAAGAMGYVSVCGNIVPRMSADLFNLTVTQHNLVAGRELFHRLLPLLNSLDMGRFVEACKAAMNLIGMSVGNPRMPRLPLPDPKVIALRQVLMDLEALTEKAA